MSELRGRIVSRGWIAITVFLTGLLGGAVSQSWGEVSITIDSPEVAYVGQAPIITWTPHGDCPEGTGWGNQTTPYFQLDGGVWVGHFTAFGLQNQPFQTELRVDNLNNFPGLHMLTIVADVVNGTDEASCAPGPTTRVVSNPIPIFIINTMAQSTRGPSDCKRGLIGNPVDVATGRMHHEMTDLRIEGPLPIEFVRRYDSQATYDGALGYGWQHDYMIRLEGLNNPSTRIFVDREMRRIAFSCSSSQQTPPNYSCLGTWTANPFEHMTMTQGTDPPSWQIADKHGMKYDFDGSGKLTRIEDRNGNSVTCGYDAGGNLTSVSDAFGRSVTLSYSGGHLQSVSAGDRTVNYMYTGDDLTRVDWTEDEFATYVTYEYTAHNMTTARDAMGNVIEAHSYDDSDRVWYTESGGGTSAYTLDYSVDGETTVTDSRVPPVETVFTYDVGTGVVTDRTDGPGCASCGDSGNRTQHDYDDFLNLTHIVDANGVTTRMTYDGSGNVLKRTEAFEELLQREWTYDGYDTTPFNFPATISVPTVGSGVCAASHPNKVVTNTYDPATGDLLTQQIEGCNGDDPFSYSTSYTYVHGQTATVNGPRTDVSDLTTYLYYPDNDVNVNARGRLESVTNALGHETTYAGYDVFGNVGSVTDPNDVETQYLYDGKDRVTEIRIMDPVPTNHIVTENHYDFVGKLDYVRLPNCVDIGMGCASSFDYVYDAANRLKEIHDPLGNMIMYSYDVEGNRTGEEYRDPSNVVQRFTNFAFDDFNRLEYVYHSDQFAPEDPLSIFTKYTYYPDGTRHTSQDPEGHLTTFDYDDLKRLTKVSQTVNGTPLETEYGYDDHDNLVSVTDPNQLETIYTNSDMGWRLTTVSPDTGTTTYSYDPAGNLVSTLDANMVATSRTYDALNRLATVTYPTDPTLNVTHSYDSVSPPVTFGIGRRTGMTDASGESVYGYDRRGLLIREEKTIGGAEYVTQYGFDPTGNLTQILYPTDDPESRQGQVDYTHDVADRVTGVLAEVNGSTTTVASAIAYKPFGPQTSLTFGNTLLDSRTYGSRYQLGTWTLGSLLNYTHTFDGDLNLGSRIDNVNAANNRAFGYDETHRLTNAAGPWGLGIGCPGGVTYTYDPNGNRLCKGEGAATTYNYITGQNRLDRTSGGETAAYSYDANGNTRGDGTHTYEYNDADRLKTVDVGATAIYTHDGDGRRVIKSVGSDTTYFFYGPGGRLLTETVPASGAGTDYVYLDGAPIGRVDWMNEEEDLGVYLRLGGDATNVLLDWTLFPADSNNYVVRRKEVVNWLDKTFDGAVTIATVTDPVQTYDDPVLDDGSRYDYRVYRNTFSESLFFYHTDHLDTPMAMTDGGRDFVWRAEYLPFGDLWSNPVSLVDSELRFPGQYRDQETGFYYNYFRTYDSSTGRYLSADPIGQAGGVNLYPYAGNDPVNWFDPFGLTEDSKANKAKRKAIAAWAAAHNQKKSTSFSFNSTYATGYSYDAKFGPQYPPAPPGSYKCSAFTCAAAAAADADTKVTVPDGRGGTVERCPTAGELAGVGRIANWRLLAPGEKRKPGDIAAGAFSSPTPGVTGHTAVVTGDQQGGTTTVGAHFHRVGPPGADIFPGGKPRYRRYIGD